MFSVYAEYSSNIVVSRIFLNKYDLMPNNPDRGRTGCDSAAAVIPAEAMRPRGIASAILGPAGVAIICSNTLSLGGLMAFRGGLALVIGAGSTALANVLIKSRAKRFEPAMMAAWQMAFITLPSRSPSDGSSQAKRCQAGRCLAQSSSSPASVLS